MNRRKCLLCDNTTNLHKFPNDKERLCQWLSAINREDLLEIPDYFKQMEQKAKLCNNHFEDWCFTSSERKTLVKFAKPFLKKTFKDELKMGSRDFRQCEALMCSNTNQNSNLSLFVFPKDNPRRLEKWLASIQMKDSNRKRKYLCSDHFDISAFTNTFKRRLLPEAVPTNSTNSDPALYHREISSSKFMSLGGSTSSQAVEFSKVGTSGDLSKNPGDDFQNSFKTEVIPDEFILPQQEFILPRLKTPIVFKNKLKGKPWNRMPWSEKDLLVKYGNINLNFRIVPKVVEGIAWESSSKYVKASLKQFFEWLLNVRLDQENPLGEFHPYYFWGYSGYNHISQTFGENDDIVQALDWSKFGYHEKPEQSSAFWIGSKGSYTPCHYDTYGCNLVAQIIGRKRWILFPPEDSGFMYPTRIPYEESSVHSSVDILNPDFQEHPLFKFAHPHIVDLEPGDVLFVPHKWWHFVQNLSPAVSVNTWIKMDVDNETHLEEAVARTMMTGLISYFEPEGISWVNTHEELFSPEETLMFVQSSLWKIKEVISSSKEANSEEQCSESNSESHSKKADFGAHSNETNSDDHVKKANPERHRNKTDSENRNNVSNSEIPRKMAKISLESNVQSENLEKTVNYLQKHPDVRIVNPTKFSDWLGKDAVIIPSDSNQILSRKQIMDCFSHPEVISVICKHLRNT